MSHSKRYKDPVYGYIDLDNELFERYIDTPEFQRLQHIRQTGYIPLYASATHNRFVHSIGVYHLGCLAFDAVERSASSIDVYSDVVWGDIRSVFLRACLLHDVGHAPFSHTGEAFYALSDNPIDSQLCELVDDVAFSKDVEHYSSNPANPHEIMSAIVGLKVYGKFFKTPFERSLFARCITGYSFRSKEPLNAVCNAVISLLNSTTIDVDKLDYLIRDAFATGFRSTVIDYERLLGGLSFRHYPDDDGDRFELVYEKSAISVLENVVYARDSERKWIQSHPVIQYESMLVSHMMESVAERFFGSCAELFCVDALTRTGKTVQGKRVRLLSDDDIVCYSKQIEDDPCIDWYFDRSSRHKPFWKSEAEFKAVFRSRLRGQYDKFVTRFKSLEKHLIEITGRPVIDEEAIEAVGGYIEKIQAEADGVSESVAQEYRCSIRRYKQSLEIMELLKQFVAALGADVRLSFTILSVSDFNSGFVPGKLEATKVHIPERELPSALKDIVSLPQISKSNSAFFYLYSDEKSKIDLALLEEKLLDYAFKL